jgi:hypothetical protein
VNWIELGEDCVQWWPLVMSLLNIQILGLVTNILSVPKVKISLRIAHLAITRPKKRLLKFVELCRHFLLLVCLSQIMVQNKITFLFLQYNGPHYGQELHYTLIQQTVTVKMPAKPNLNMFKFFGSLQ